MRIGVRSRVAEQGGADRRPTPVRWTRSLAMVVGVLVPALVIVVGAPGANAVGAQTSDSPGSEAGSSIVVATKPLEPFVFVDSDAPDGSGLRGYSIDVWNEIAQRLDLETTWVVEETVGDIIESTTAGDVDAAIAGISMTAERETVIDFAYPYYDSGLQMVVRPSSNQSAWSTVWGLLSNPTVLGLVAGLALLTLLIAHAVWYTERRHNDEFPHRYWEGIGEALWWSTVSLVTGGEAVKNIRRPASRLLAVVWMVIGLFLIAFVTARAASAITLNELRSDIGGLDDLPGRSVVTVEGTVAETFLAEVNIPTDTVADVDQGLAAVADGRYDALVYDTPVLAYRINTDYAGRLELAGEQFAPDPYGIALVTGSPLREDINAQILAMSRDGTLDALNQKWLGTDR